MSSIPSTSPSKSTPPQFCDYEGTTIFAPPPAPTYRYSLVLKTGKLRIWLEDCGTKKQWCTPELELREYVDSTNAIPDASTSDYVECFHELLGAAGNDLFNIPSTFQRHTDEGFQLNLRVKLQALLRTRTITYTFCLEPISVERLDVLESKMRDTQEDVRKQQARVSTLEYLVGELQNEVKQLRHGSNAQLPGFNLGQNQPLHFMDPPKANQGFVFAPAARKHRK